MEEKCFAKCNSEMDDCLEYKDICNDIENIRTGISQKLLENNISYWSVHSLIHHVSNISQSYCFSKNKKDIKKVVNDISLNIDNILNDSENVENIFKWKDFVSQEERLALLQKLL